MRRVTNRKNSIYNKIKDSSEDSSNFQSKGEIIMGDKGSSRQKNRKEQKKKAKNTILDKRKIKKEKKKNK